MSDLQHITPDILQSNSAWAQAFRDYAATQRNIGNVELAIAGTKRIYPNVWNDFLDSRPAQVLLDNPPAPGTPWYTPEPAPKTIPTKTVKEVFDVPETPETLPYIKITAQQTPETTPAPIPMPETTPETKIAPAPQQTPKNPYKDNGQVITSSNPLIDLIATGLKDIGFTPEKALSAEQVTRIAESAGLDLIEKTIAQLEREGKLGGKAHTIHYQIDRNPIKELSGRTPAFFDDLMKLVLCGIPSFLVGPAGSGKTTAVEKLAHVLDLPFTRVSLSAGVDEGALQGWLLPMELGGRFVYVPAPMVRAYEHGGVVLLDEIDSADANMLIILSAVLDESSWHIPLRSDKPALVKHENVHFVAAANTWGHGADMLFVGANQLDERTLSRFRQGQIHCDYDNDLEQETFHAGVVEYGHLLRKRCRAVKEFKRDVSTRDIALNTRKARAIDKTTGKPVYSVEQAWFHHFADWKDQELTVVHARKDKALKAVFLD